jgi:lipopolysaccharide export system protein LptA
LKIRVAVYAVLALACASIVFAAQQTVSTKGESLKADNIERLADNTVRATGNAEFTGRGFQLHADSLELRRIPASGDTSVELVAEGNVILTRGQDRLVVQRLQFNPSTGTGVFQLPQGKH